jgi:transcriptional regulator PpsR
LSAVAGDDGERVLTALCDLSLVVDGQGVIVSATRGSAAAADPPTAWQSLLGRPLVDVVTVESRAKVSALLADARRTGRSQTREVNVVDDVVGEVPFRVTLASVDRERLIAFAVDMRPIAGMQQRLVTAQQALEREHERIRQAEVQYRVLFHVCAEGVVIARGSPPVIDEINPAMSALLGVRSGTVRGMDTFELVEAGSTDAFRSLLASAEAGRSNEALVRLRGDVQSDVVAAATVFRQAGDAVLLLRFWRPGALVSGMRARDDRQLDVIAAMPDAFVVTDAQLRVLTANAAFCTLVERPSELQVVGQSLGVWLGHHGTSLDVMLSSVRDRGYVRAFATALRSEFGAEQEVQVTAVAAMHGEEPIYGFTMRAAAPRAPVAPRMLTAGSRVEVSDLVGRMSLKDIVQESADLVERLCIEAALEISGNNRAAAAKLLRLSRQSLYTKLRGLGMADPAQDPSTGSSFDD